MNRAIPQAMPAGAGALRNLPFLLAAGLVCLFAVFAPLCGSSIAAPGSGPSLLGPVPPGPSSAASEPMSATSEAFGSGRNLPSTFPGDVDLLPLLMRFLLGFAAVLAAVLAVRAFLERRGGIRSFKYGRVIETVPLHQGAALYIVETAGKFLVVGATQTSVSHIAEIDDPKAIEILRFSDPAKGVQFRDMIAELIVQGSERLETAAVEAEKAVEEDALPEE